MSSQTDQNAYPYDTERVSELLKRKRKVRGIRSCFPCRHRKVRCDGRVPCASCVQRSHPELCRVPKSSSGGRAASEEHDSAAWGSHKMNLDYPTEDVQETGYIRPQAQPPAPPSDPTLLAIQSRLDSIQNQLAAIQVDLRASTRTAASSRKSSPGPVPRTNSKSPGQHFVEDATGATIFLGSHSDTPLALGCRQAATAGDAVLYDAMVDQFVPRAYPFTNLWGSDAAVKDVCETLPDDSDTIRYWQTYQSIANPFYPVLVAVEQFGAELFAFLDQRALARETGSRAEERDPSWLALLFAVLACGVQFSDDPIKERDLRSKVLICSSFQCLRLSNFFNRPDLAQIQAMALIGNCLRNNLDTNCAWILMGATIRLAQSIGLHEASLSLPESEQAQRSHLWWTLIWQDTFLSFTYDRPPSTAAMMNCPIPYATPPQRGGHSFSESIFTICSVLLGRAAQASSLQLSLDCKRQLDALPTTAAPFLTNKSRCASLQDHLERLALGVHLGYTVCRLSRDVLLLGDEDPDTAAADCVRSGLAAVESFLDLHRFSARVCRSWPFVHSAVSCAITMRGLERRGVAGETGARNLRVEAAVRRLMGVLEKEAKESEWCDADTNVRHFGPYSRELKALREIYGGGNEG